MLLYILTIRLLFKVYEAVKMDKFCVCAPYAAWRGTNRNHFLYCQCRK